MSNLTIGFTNKYFTLWSVESQENYSESNGKNYLSSITTKNTYWQNLSMDEDKAKAKAKELGATNLCVNDDLKGEKRTFSTNQYFPEPKPEKDEFQMGKYKWEKISESDDLKYLLWYAYDQDCVLSKKRICELDKNYKFTKGNLTTPQDRAKKNLSNGKTILTSESNFSGCGEGIEIDGFAWIRVSFEIKTEAQQLLCDDNGWGISLRVDVRELDLVRKEFRGNEYFVPKGKRSFKGVRFILKNDTMTVI